MLKNAYFLAKIGADTAENERNFAKNWQLPYGSAAAADPGAEVRPPGRPRCRALGAAPRHRCQKNSDPFRAPGRANLTGLVLGCIKTKFCKKICVWQHFSSSTRFASFCTAAISKFSQKIGSKNLQFSWKINKNFANHVVKFAKFCQISKISAW